MIAVNRNAILGAAAVASLVVLHFVDRPSSSTAPAPPVVSPEVPRAAPSTPRAAAPVRALAVDCGGSSSTITGDDHHGTIVVSGDAPLHGDVGVCVVSFATIALRRCAADPARYTVIQSAGKIEIVGPQPGETITYACDGR